MNPAVGDLATRVAFGELTPQHLPARHFFDFPYAVGVLSRARGSAVPGEGTGGGMGGVNAWFGSFGEDRRYFDQSYKWMSVTKVLVAVAFWRAARRGVLNLEMPLSVSDSQEGMPEDTALNLGQELCRLGAAGVSLADLLSHSAGLPFDAPLEREGSETSQMGVELGISTTGVKNIPPGTKRVYSNYSIEVATRVVQMQLGCNWTDWVRAEVLTPLGMVGTKIADSPAWGAAGPITDLARLAAALLEPPPEFLDKDDLVRWTRPRHPGLRGVLPGFGSQRDNLWATGVELRGKKSPHWLPIDFPAEVFGHFGQSGSFLWVDRATGTAGVFLGAAPFSEVHRQVWPQLNAEIRALALAAQT